MLTGSLRKPYHLIGIDICNYPGGITYAELGLDKNRSAATIGYEPGNSKAPNRFRQ